MIGQEGSQAQLNKYTVNKPPPTTTQIKTAFKPITDFGGNLFKGISNTFNNLIKGISGGATKIFWIIIILFVVYLFGSIKK
jgi:uncharacterized membrane protein YtjA (UPF0391 family)